jgi:hypothetical protein
MENEVANQETAHDPKPRTTLTTEQVEQVAGGTLSLGHVLVGGCPACTSGRPLAFQNLAAVVNPDPIVNPSLAVNPAVAKQGLG